MNIFSQPRKVFKCDYHGNLYETTTIQDPQRDLGAMWKEFIAANNKPEDEARKHIVYAPGQHQEVNQVWAEREAEKILNEKE